MNDSTLYNRAFLVPFCGLFVVLSLTTLISVNINYNPSSTLMRLRDLMLIGSCSIGVTGIVIGIILKISNLATTTGKWLVCTGLAYIVLFFLAYKYDWPNISPPCKQGELALPLDTPAQFILLGMLSASTLTVIMISKNFNDAIRNLNNSLKKPKNRAKFSKNAEDKKNNIKLPCAYFWNSWIAFFQIWMIFFILTRVALSSINIKSIWYDINLIIACLIILGVFWTQLYWYATGKALRKVEYTKNPAVYEMNFNNTYKSKDFIIKIEPDIANWLESKDMNEKILSSHINQFLKDAIDNAAGRQS